MPPPSRASYGAGARPRPAAPGAAGGAALLGAGSCLTTRFPLPSAPTGCKGKEKCPAGEPALVPPSGILSIPKLPKVREILQARQ